MAGKRDVSNKSKSASQKRGNAITTVPFSNVHCRTFIYPFFLIFIHILYRLYLLTLYFIVLSHCSLCHVSCVSLDHENCRNWHHLTRRLVTLQRLHKRIIIVFIALLFENQMQEGRRSFIKINSFVGRIFF